MVNVIYNKLDELNAPWKKIVDDYHSGEGSE